MFPFLIKNKQRKASGGVIVQERNQNLEENQELNYVDPIETSTQYLIYCIQNNDAKAAASALRSIFEMLEQEPHEEGPHIEPHSFEAQNIRK